MSENGVGVSAPVQTSWSESSSTTPATGQQVLFKSLLERREGVEDCIPDPALTEHAIL